MKTYIVVAMRISNDGKPDQASIKLLGIFAFFDDARKRRVWARSFGGYSKKEWVVLIFDEVMGILSRTHEEEEEELFNGIYY